MVHTVLEVREEIHVKSWDLRISDTAQIKLLRPRQRRAGVIGPTIDLSAYYILTYLLSCVAVFHSRKLVVVTR